MFSFFSSNKTQKLFFTILFLTFIFVLIINISFVSASDKKLTCNDISVNSLNKKIHIYTSISAFTNFFEKISNYSNISNCGKLLYNTNDYNLYDRCICKGQNCISVEKVNVKKEGYNEGTIGENSLYFFVINDLNYYVTYSFDNSYSNIYLYCEKQRIVSNFNTLYFTVNEDNKFSRYVLFTTGSNVYVYKLDDSFSPEDVASTGSTTGWQKVDKLTGGCPPGFSPFPSYKNKALDNKKEVTVPRYTIKYNENKITITCKNNNKCVSLDTSNGKENIESIKKDSENVFFYYYKTKYFNQRAIVFSKSFDKITICKRQSSSKVAASKRKTAVSEKSEKTIWYWILKFVQESLR